MPKYVCDFETVKDNGNKMLDIAKSISSSINTYSQTIDKDLSSWEGVAKNSFDKTNTNQIEAGKKTANYVNEKGEFILKVANSIEQLETELASLTI